VDESAAEGHSAELLLPEEAHFDLASNLLSPRDGRPSINWTGQAVL